MAFFPTFETIIGHDSNISGMCAAIKVGKPGHSHLFHGPKGVGKAATALAFAQVLLCKDREEGSAKSCGVCSSCKKIEGGQHPDFTLVEMLEDKTRITVEQIRELSAFLSLTPMESQWKIALIDDGAQMNISASNALLKTLEEPPDQSILIINSSRPGLLLPTIRSRCTKTRFSGLRDEELFEIVGKIVKSSSEDIKQAVAMSGGDVAQAVGLCESGLGEERQRFLRDIEEIGSVNLSRTCSIAEYWSTAARFATMLLLLKAWFQEQIRGSVESDGGGESTRNWLSLVQWADDIMRQAMVVNLNRRLVLESVFIKLARLRGAKF
ncbi:MAG: DNA polymerase III subunit delta' [Magnetococcales bacterium]|nr:DNA polymerase III subunit delta' [Magnetococcales bacterium]